MSTHSTKQFYYTKETRNFSACASEVPIRLQQLYSDACDVGIVLVSHVTGKEIKFYLVEEKHDREGDLLYWKFKNDQVNCTVTVFND